MVDFSGSQDFMQQAGCTSSSCSVHMLHHAWHPRFVPNLLCFCLLLCPFHVWDTPTWSASHTVNTTLHISDPWHCQVVTLSAQLSTMSVSLFNVVLSSAPWHAQSMVVFIWCRLVTAKKTQ